MMVGGRSEVVIEVEVEGRHYDGRYPSTVNIEGQGDGWSVRLWPSKPGRGSGTSHQDQDRQDLPGGSEQERG